MKTRATKEEMERALRLIKCIREIYEAENTPYAEQKAIVCASQITGIPHEVMENPDRYLIKAESTQA